MLFKTIKTRANVKKLILPILNQFKPFYSV